MNRKKVTAQNIIKVLFSRSFGISATRNQKYDQSRALLFRPLGIFITKILCNLLKIINSVVSCTYKNFDIFPSLFDILNISKCQFFFLTSCNKSCLRTPCPVLRARDYQSSYLEYRHVWNQNNGNVIEHLLW